MSVQRAQALQCSLILLGRRGWFGEDGGEVSVSVRVDPAPWNTGDVQC